VERGPLAYKPLRAPADNLRALIEPGPAEWRANWCENRRRLAAGDDRSWAGMSFGALRQSARERLLDDARRHTGQYRVLENAPPFDKPFDSQFDSQFDKPFDSQFDKPFDSQFDKPLDKPPTAPPIVLTGHQPQLFHPGVWFKNFVVAALARQVAAPAVNLIIDNDTIRTAAVRVPRGSIPAAHDLETGPPTGGEHSVWASTVEFDRPGDEVPFEERAVLDRERFRRFPEAVRAQLAPEWADPMVNSLWPAACAALADTDRLGLCLSRARNMIEAENGVELLDVPLSTVSDAWPFRWFAVGLLEEAERFRGIHNGVLDEYRRTHRIRSRSHPVPELARDGEWQEAPFWMWTSSMPRRRRLFTRRLPDRLELTDRAGWRLILARPGDGDATRAVDQLGEARRQGVKLRPRALLTTLFARLVLGDHFVHGIGGAKYDQLTDAICERFFGLAPPAFITATATVRLPLELSSATSPPPADSTAAGSTLAGSTLAGSNLAGSTLDGSTLAGSTLAGSTAANSRQAQENLRALRFHPEVFLSERELAAERIAALVAEKRRWLALELPRGQRLARHRALGALNESLYDIVRHREAGLLRDLAAARREERRRALLRSREFSYALFPKKWLVSRLLELAAPSS
jgi:hypothetical protein